MAVKYNNSRRSCARITSRILVVTTYPVGMVVDDKVGTRKARKATSLIWQTACGRTVIAESQPDARTFERLMISHVREMSAAADAASTTAMQGMMGSRGDVGPSESCGAAGAAASQHPQQCVQTAQDPASRPMGSAAMLVAVAMLGCALSLSTYAANSITPAVTPTSGNPENEAGSCLTANALCRIQRPSRAVGWKINHIRLARMCASAAGCVLRSPPPSSRTAFKQPRQEASAKLRRTLLPSGGSVGVDPPRGWSGSGETSPGGAFLIPARWERELPAGAQPCLCNLSCPETRDPFHCVQVAPEV